jgi:hypothetical protein
MPRPWRIAYRVGLVALIVIATQALAARAVAEPVCVGDPANGECFPANGADGWSLAQQDQLSPYVEQIYAALADDPNYADIGLDFANHAVRVLYHGGLPGSLASIIADAQTAGVGVEAVPTGFGLSTLASAAATLGDALNALGISWSHIALGDYSGLQVAGHALTGDTGLLNTISTLAANLIPGIPITFTDLDPADLLSSRVDDHPPFHGGAREDIDFEDYGYDELCTSGFAVASTTFTYYLLTAAHCAHWFNNRRFFSPGGTTFGRNIRTGTFLNNKLDATLVPVSSSIAQVYTGASYNSSTVTDINGVHSFAQGYSVCASGATSAIHCDLSRTATGLITANVCLPNQAPWSGNRCRTAYEYQVDDGLANQVIAAGGDSGGPVYQLTNSGTRYGVGLIEAGDNAINCSLTTNHMDPVGGYPCYSRLYVTPLTSAQNVMNQWGDHVGHL